ncbi:2,3-bisphosphoglycerate-dependent phosphoglycerate mutase [Methyloligella halotolerans]|uniref:2,3-bisphosphoglycerate-dependent phosphoglycerate mutase n=1 Tax=Methyloligella halotolerans TaxID=1177755 RepID=A0A1E2S226_9HYPH|nr:histidine phosphatase family protein [Methyloligella halotolerans]ODA68472.1 2,3-bisphosphoglycerate-dependent phosphoglycerate mutase [Methyloligella halotolerans]
MLRLSLLRHAKSSWKNPGMADIDRSLSSRGRVAAPVMGDAIAERGMVPDLVLCSSARRTRETLDLASQAWEPPPAVEYREELYHAAPDTLLDIVREQMPETKHLMLIGHNPGFHLFGFDLIGRGPKHARERLGEKFPTCGLLVADFAVGEWADIRYGTGELSLFLVPADLGLTPSPIDP